MDYAACRLSLSTLKQMQKNREEFYTVARHKKLLIVDADERSQKIVMKRSTGKNTWPSITKNQKTCMIKFTREN